MCQLRVWWKPGTERTTLGANLVTLETGDELSRRKGHFGSRLSVKVPNELERQDQSPPFSNAALLFPRCTIGANFVILAETSDELSRRHGPDGRADGKTDGQTGEQTDGRR